MRLVRILAAIILATVLGLAGFAGGVGAGAILAGAHGANAAATGAGVDVYKGVDRPGKARNACGFQDGIFIQRGEIEDNRIVVTDPLNREYYRSDTIPALDNYAVQSLACIRSAQTGYLVVVVGGFYAGTGGQQSLTLSTAYPIAEPVTHEQYLAGQR